MTPDSMHAPRCHRASVSLVLLLCVFVVGQSGDCEQPTGNTDLTLLELEDDGLNVIVGFVSSERIYAASVTKNPVTLRAQSVEAGANISLLYQGASQPIGVGSGEIDVSVILGDSPLIITVEATGGLVRSYVINVTHDVPPVTEPIAVACANSITAPNSLVFDLTVRAPSIAGGAASVDFAAEISGVARVPRVFLQSASNIVPGGIQQGSLDDVAATVQVRSGATGADVVLSADLNALVPGPTNLCLFPPDQVCDPANDLDPEDPSAGNTDCLGGVAGVTCQPEVVLIDFPVSTDCEPGGVCDSVYEGNSNPYSGCALAGFCILEDLEIPLAKATGTFSPDPSGEILFGWADQGVPDLALCPAAAPACGEAYHPDGAYDLPAAVYTNPPAPLGVRTDLFGLFLPLQCAMAEPGGVCSAQTNLACLSDADCGASGPCDFSVEGVAIPTPDSALLAVPIGDPAP